LLKTKLRQARLSDIPAAVSVDNHSWPEHLWTTKEQFLARLEVFPEGFIVAENGGHVVGVITSLRTTRKWIVQETPTWHEITDGGFIRRSHDPNGDCLFLMSVNVSPQVRGLALGNRLVNAQIELAARLDNVESILGYTRIPRYKRHSDLSVQEYLKLTRRTSDPLDSILRFHVKNGAEVLKPIKGGRPADADSLGYSVLISYSKKLKEFRKKVQLSSR